MEAPISFYLLATTRRGLVPVPVDPDIAARFAGAKAYVHRKWVNELPYHYCYVRIDGERKALHRLIADVQDGVLVDHKDGDGLNNRRTNLRPCSHGQNMMNRRKPRSNVSGFKGVFSRRIRASFERLSPPTRSGTTSATSAAPRKPMPHA